MRRLFIPILVSVFAALSVGSQEKKQEAKPAPAPAPVPPPEWKIPGGAAKRVNPIKSGETSIASGKRLYETQCAMCHGTAGDGKGDLVASMELKMHDWGDPATFKEVTDGGLFYVIEQGKGKMPDQKGRMKDDQIWNLVNFVRSVAKKEPAADTKKEKP